MAKEQEVRVIGLAAQILGLVAYEWQGGSTSRADEAGAPMLEIRVDERGNDKYGAFQVGTHDDLVTALGLAVLPGGPRPWITVL